MAHDRFKQFLEHSRRASNQTPVGTQPEQALHPSTHRTEPEGFSLHRPERHPLQGGHVVGSLHALPVGTTEKERIGGMHLEARIRISVGQRKQVALQRESHTGFLHQLALQAGLERFAGIHKTAG